LTGTGRWGEWLRGLGFYADSQQGIPTLYGFALPGFVPLPVYLALAGLAIAAAVAVRGRDSLARLGLATVVGSPSLYTHGFLTALPAFLALRSFWLWLVLAVTSTVLGPGWWLAVAIGASAWFIPALRREAAQAEPLHPLPAGREVWPRRHLVTPGSVRRAEAPFGAETSPG
jgi:hypothetical protein